MRDLKADLKLCEMATPGPWVCQVVEDGISPRVFVTRSFGVEVPPKFYIAFLPDMCFGDSEADAEFIAAAREGWPEAIRRAMEAEHELDQIKAIVGHPGTKELPWDCPTSEVVRWTHRKWLEQMHSSTQRVIEAETVADHAEARALAAEARVAELESRLAQLERVATAARRICAKSPFDYDREHYKVCRYCHRWDGDGHSNDCAWVELRRALGIEDEGAGVGDERNDD